MDEDHTPAGQINEPGLTGQGGPALFASLYGELRRQAHWQRRKMRAGQTLSTTALVNEAYMKLVRADGFIDRVHFLRTAAAAMRQVLVDGARASLAEKRGRGEVPLSIDQTGPLQIAADPVQDAASLLALDQVLGRLADVSERLAQVVECRYFGGYTEGETAELLGVTERTVRRDWKKARAWLFDALASA